MPRVVVNTTFRDFTGDVNDEMQIKFLKSLRRQTFQDYILVVSVFYEKRVETVVRSILGDRCTFIYDACEGNYRFSLSKTFKNGIDFGIQNGADILLDCSSDIILQKNFLEVIVNRCHNFSAGISHPNVFLELTDKGEKKYSYGKISYGIDTRFFTLDLFRQEEVYKLLDKFPSYDYGAGIESIMCGIAIRYAKYRCNIFEEAKVAKIENDRGGRVNVTNSFMREGHKRNLPTVHRFLDYVGLGRKYAKLIELNKAYRPTGRKLNYYFKFGGQYLHYFIAKYNKP